MVGGKLAEAYVEIGAETAGFDRGLDHSQAKLQGFVKSGNSLLAAFGASMGVAVGVEVFKDFVMAASDLQETMNKVQQVFGSSSSVITTMTDDLADRFGLVKKTTLDAAASIGLVGQASGMSAAQSADLATRFTKLAADASSFYNVPLEEALNKIRSGLVGEAEPIRAFGVLLSDAAMKAEALKMGLTTTNRELTEGEKVAARASLIYKGLSKASGDLERTQDDLANAIRRVNGELENAKAEWGKPLAEWTKHTLSAGRMVGKDTSILGHSAASGAMDLLDKNPITYLTGLSLRSAAKWAGYDPEEKMQAAMAKASGADKPTKPIQEEVAKRAAEEKKAAEAKKVAEERERQRLKVVASYAREQSLLTDAFQRAAGGKLGQLGIGYLQGGFAGAAHAAAGSGMLNPLASMGQSGPSPWTAGRIFGGNGEFARVAQEKILSEKDPEKRSQLEEAKKATAELKDIGAGIKELIRATSRAPGMVVKGRA